MALIRFYDIAGQDKAKRLLRLASERRKISHAYMFQGPAGVGKKMTARAYAAFLLCLGVEDRDDSCGQCPSCRKIASGNHPDFLVIEPDGVQIKIDQIRALKKELSYPPVEGGWRVVLLADIHLTMARAEVANSLLKTLEEPPAQTVFILTAVEAAGILPTIVSRCQVVPFYPLAFDIVAAALLVSGDVSAERARTLASIAEGSLGRAMELASTELLEVRKSIAEGLTGITPAQSGAVERVFALAERAAVAKDELENLLELLIFWVKDLMVQGVGGPVEALVNQDLCHLGDEAGRRWNFSQLGERLTMIRQAQKQLRHNCNRAFVCEVLFWKFVQL